MGRLLPDLRSAARMFARHPTLAAAAVATLALGIGVNSAIFSIVDAALLTPPPFREPGRVVILWGSNPDFAQKVGMENELPAANPTLDDLRQASRSFEELGLAQAN